MITFTDVSKSFGSINALTEINLDIKKAEFVFITGTSGSGKTTLLRLITRDLLPDKGKMVVNGIDVVKLKPSRAYLLRRQIGVVFQDFKLLIERTIYENVALALQILDKVPQDLDQRVRRTLKMVGLGGKEELFPLQLAGGELQRVCLARAVVTHPPILLADEPTGNLDPTTSWQIMELIKQINQQGTSVVMATHNWDIVNSMSERVVKLEKGKMVKDEEKGKYEIK